MLLIDIFFLQVNCGRSRIFLKSASFSAKQLHVLLVYRLLAPMYGSCRHERRLLYT